MVAIREENPEHHTAIAILHHAVFGGSYESDLVDHLRRDGLAVVSLVAHREGDMIGHILFSELAVEIEGKSVRAVALAPLAVRADCRGAGIGAGLVRQGLGLLHLGKWQAVLVLGHTAYYSRFGFSPEATRGLDAPFRGDSFMALELQPGSIAGRKGTVRYPPAFRLG